MGHTIREYIDDIKAKELEKDVDEQRRFEDDDIQVACTCLPFFEFHSWTNLGPRSKIMKILKTTMVTMVTMVSTLFSEVNSAGMHL